MEQSFKKEFDALAELGTEGFTLRGSSVICEILPQEEIKTAGGLIVATDINQVRGNSIKEHLIQTARVLMVGQGYWNEDTLAYEPLEVKPGAIVLLPQYGTQYISVFPGIVRPTGNKLCVVKMDQIMAYYPSPEAYLKAKTALN